MFVYHFVAPDQDSKCPRKKGATKKEDVEIEE